MRHARDSHFEQLHADAENPSTTWLRENYRHRSPKEDMSLLPLYGSDDPTPEVQPIAEPEPATPPRRLASHISIWIRDFRSRSRRVMEKLGMTYNPTDDFEHPLVPEGHPLRRHVLYRLRNSDWQRVTMEQE